jgi:hypothetical protein
LSAPISAFSRGIGTEEPTASVSWAGTGPVPVWLDQVRELLLDAVGRPSDLRADLAGPVLDGLRWAYPFRLGYVTADPATR